MIPMQIRSRRIEHAAALLCCHHSFCCDCWTSARTHVSVFKFSIFFNFYHFELKMIIAADETRSCSMCRQQPPPWRQPQSATSQARADRRLVGGGRGEPFLPTPWTAQTLEWSPAHWLNLSQLTRGNMYVKSSPKNLGMIHQKRPKPFQLN